MFVCSLPGFYAVFEFVNLHVYAKTKKFKKCKLPSVIVFAFLQRSFVDYVCMLLHFVFAVVFFTGT